MRGIPTFFLIDQNGEVIYHQSGWGNMMEPMLEGMIDDRLKGFTGQTAQEVYDSESTAQPHLARTAIDPSGDSSGPMPILPGLSPGTKPGSAAGPSKPAPAAGSPSGVTAPAAIYEPGPPYTKAARSNGIEGTVTLQIVVSAQGKVSDVKEVGAHLGYGLDENAIATVRTWRFRPAMRGGSPVQVRVTVVVSFRLGEEP